MEKQITCPLCGSLKLEFRPHEKMDVSPSSICHLYLVEFRCECGMNWVDEGYVISSILVAVNGWSDWTGVETNIATLRRYRVKFFKKK